MTATVAVTRPLEGPPKVAWGRGKQLIDHQRLAGKIPVSFDVVSLYTDVDTEEAITVVLEYTLKYKVFTHRLQNSDLWELLRLVL